MTPNMLSDILYQTFFPKILNYKIGQESKRENKIDVGDYFK